MQCKVQISRNAMQQVEILKYLGVPIASDTRSNKNINTRIHKANAVLREFYSSAVETRELIFRTAGAVMSTRGTIFAIIREPLKLRQHIRHCTKGFFTRLFLGVDDAFVTSDRKNQNFGAAKKAVVMFKDV